MFYIQILSLELLFLPREESRRPGSVLEKKCNCSVVALLVLSWFSPPPCDNNFKAQLLQDQSGLSWSVPTDNRETIGATLRTKSISLSTRISEYELVAVGKSTNLDNVGKFYSESSSVSPLPVVSPSLPLPDHCIRLSISQFLYSHQITYFSYFYISDGILFENSKHITITAFKHEEFDEWVDGCWFDICQIKLKLKSFTEKYKRVLTRWDYSPCLIQISHCISSISWIQYLSGSGWVFVIFQILILEINQEYLIDSSKEYFLIFTSDC